MMTGSRRQDLYSSAVNGQQCLYPFTAVFVYPLWLTFRDSWHLYDDWNWPAPDVTGVHSCVLLLAAILVQSVQNLGSRSLCLHRRGSSTSSISLRTKNISDGESWYSYFQITRRQAVVLTTSEARSALRGSISVWVWLECSMNESSVVTRGPADEST